MSEKPRRPGVQHQGNVDDQHRASETNQFGAGGTALPVPSLVAAGLCACWRAPERRRCHMQRLALASSRARSAARRGPRSAT
jgi:hypothetical protein